MTHEPPSPSLLRRIALALVLAGLLAMLALHRRPHAARAAPPAAGLVRAAPASAALLSGGRLDLNVATADDLSALPGIGPVRAQRIIDERSARGGRFERVEDLLDVSGIGPVTFGRIRDSVRVD